VKSRWSRSEGGLGIGLSLVRKLMEMHGGSVSAASQGTGRGSTFIVRMPLTEDIPAPEESAALVTRQRDLARHRILVVDDNLDAAASLAMLLAAMGHDVDTANDGPGGIAKAATMRPDLVFLDLGMPRMDGLETARHLRALPDGKDMTVVALTGWAQQHDLLRTRMAGFDEHLLKPIDPLELDRLLAAPVDDTSSDTR
jgi:CheY-like chemotaxis protein